MRFEVALYNGPIRFCRLLDAHSSQSFRQNDGQVHKFVQVHKQTHERHYVSEWTTNDRTIEITV